MKSRIGSKQFVIVALFTFVGVLSFGQGVSLTHYNVEDGLPSSEVYDVIQDEYGYIWFCTDKGLSRYNGYEFKNYDKNNGAPDNVVFNFFQCKNGEIWCTSRSLEVFRISGKEPIFTSYPYSSVVRDEGQNSPVQSLCVLPNQSVLFQLKSHSGFVEISNEGQPLKVSDHIDFKMRKSYLYVVKSAGSHPFYFTDTSNLYSNIFPDSQLEKLDQPIGHINNAATYLYQHKTGVFSDGTELYLKNEETTIKLDSQNNKEILTVGKLNEDVFWVSYFKGGVKLFSPDGKKLNHFLPSETVTKLFQDFKGNYWVSTLYNGVFLLKNTNVRYFDSSRGRRISSIASAKNDLYVGYVNGDVYALSNNDSLVSYYASKAHNKSTILHDAITNTTYFCSGHIFSTKSDFIKRNSSNYLALDDDRLLYGNASTLALEISNPTNQTVLFPRQKMHDVIVYNNRIYGGNTKGLFYVNKEDVSNVLSTSITTRIDDLNRINQYLVLGTNGEGVKILDENHLVVLTFNQSNGLRSNFVNQTYSENDTTLWVCTNNGLNRIQYNNNGFNMAYIDANDGLLSNEIWNLEIHNKKVFVGTQKGLNYLSLLTFNQLQEEDTLHFFTWNKTYVNGNAFDLLKKHDFTHNENTIDFHFEAISFSNKNNFWYRYKLEGLDVSWNITAERNVRYAGLAPGQYTLIIQAKGRSGDWKKNELRYSFEISPPFWSTWWFFGLMALLIVGIIYLFFKLRILRYNGDIVREILRLILQRLRNDQPFILIKDKGNQLKIHTSLIHFVKTNGNYLELHTPEKVYLIRSSINQFFESLPDAIEFIQVHRSYLVRVDKVNEIGTKTIVILNQDIPIGRKYANQIKLLKEFD